MTEEIKLDTSLLKELMLRRNIEGILRRHLGENMPDDDDVVRGLVTELINCFKSLSGVLNKSGEKWN